jgi:hypothetical protein
MPSRPKVWESIFGSHRFHGTAQVNAIYGIEKQGFVLPAMVQARGRFCVAPFIFPFPWHQKKQPASLKGSRLNK